MADGDEGVARVLARPEGQHRETLREIHRHVLHRVHRDVGEVVGERDLELLDEQPLAAHLREGPVEDAVALGGHARDLDLEPGVALLEARGHVLGLPHRELAFAGGDADALGRQGG